MLDICIYILFIYLLIARNLSLQTCKTCKTSVILVFFVESKNISFTSNESVMALVEYTLQKFYTLSLQTFPILLY